MTRRPLVTWGPRGSRQRLFASFVHNAIVHPLLVVAEVLDATGWITPRVIAYQIGELHDRTAPPETEPPDARA
jgi:hypothetical protein